MNESERHFGRTNDGWTIALHRRRASWGTSAQPPILLCHGLGANRFNLDAPGPRSIARWLANEGFDVWVIELRGAGLSSRPSSKNQLQWNWTFDDYVNHDIPTALDVIERVTGHRKVHWLGHSLGGMVAYAFVINHGNHRLQSIATVGSPSFSRLGNDVFDRIAGFRKLVGLVRRLPYERSGYLLVPTVPIFKETLGWLFGHPRNLESRTLRQLLTRLPSDLPTSLIMQLGDWYVDGGFTDSSGQKSYSKALATIEAPTLLIVGNKDFLTPPADIQYVYDALSSSEKKLVVLSRANGCRYDYGHIDPILGRYAQDEVWPLIKGWFEAHTSP
ncbi:MAG: alpha/beta hydrolase [Myxococcota bacterium]|nr:alpha/beta hydrolase [Myxococcota bacterium]